MKEDEDADKILITSEPVTMTGGSKYKLDLKYFHSSHNKFVKKSDPFLALYW